MDVSSTTRYLYDKSLQLGIYTKSCNPLHSYFSQLDPFPESPSINDWCNWLLHRPEFLLRCSKYQPAALINITIIFLSCLIFLRLLSPSPSLRLHVVSHLSSHSSLVTLDFLSLSMDFFKSVFSPDLDPEHDQSSDKTASASSNPNPNPTSGGWNLGGLIKTVASKSESVIQTYRRDLEEFGSGLKKETAVIREVAARSVDEIIKHGKEALAVDSNDDSFDNALGKRYTRLEAQIMAIQSDEGTFTTDPEDMKDFENWKIGFDLEEKKEEIEMLMYDSNVVESMSEKFIPDIVDYWTFWYRYFYRVYKVKQAEEARAELVKRVISRDDEEEELSWEVEDDEELDKIGSTLVEKQPNDGEEKQEIDEIIRSGDTQSGKEKQDGEKNRGLDEIQNIEGTQVEMVKKEGEMKRELNELEQNGDDPVEKVEKDQKWGMEKGGTSETQESGSLKELKNKQEEKTTNASVEKDTTIPEPVPTKSAEVPNEVSTSAIAIDEKLNLKSEAEEDLEWDEIEDLGEGDNNKPSGSIASPKLKEDLRKRLSVAEDDEDLTWDIEEDDDDVPAKK